MTSWQRRSMMSGDTPNTKPEIIELQEQRIGTAPFITSKLVDKGVQCDEYNVHSLHEPLRLSSVNDLRPMQLPHTHPLPATASTFQEEGEEEILVANPVPQVASEREEKKSVNHPPGGRIIEPEEDPGCLIQCLYYTDKCCECTII